MGLVLVLAVAVRLAVGPAVRLAMGLAVAVRLAVGPAVGG